MDGFLIGIAIGKIATREMGKALKIDHIGKLVATRQECFCAACRYLKRIASLGDICQGGKEFEDDLIILNLVIVDFDRQARICT